MTAPWVPKRTLAETDAILCEPGMPHELETRLVDGRIQRVYKNLWPSIRDFWLSVSDQFKDRTYLVFEHQRWTYGETARRVMLAARIFQTTYGIQKGDRVTICSRNFPDFIVAFWACHLIGAVSVLVNAWLRFPALHHCLVHVQSKLIIVDPERADLIEPIAITLRDQIGTTGILVIEHQEGKGNWRGMHNWNQVLRDFGDNRLDELENTSILPDDNATIIFTSGTTGLPKGVLSTQRMFLTNSRNLSAGSSRAVLRSGLERMVRPEGPQKGLLISVPLFHVTGMTSLVVSASVNGLKIVLMRKWTPKEGLSLIKRENIAVAGGVPTIVSDLIENSDVNTRLDSLVFGGSCVNRTLPETARKVFPNAFLSQAYGMTETNSVAICFTGDDYTYRPTSTGIPSPVNDILIVTDGKAQHPGQVGEIWLRGPNIMKEYWRDPEATAKALTRDGWLRTGDLGVLDEEGFLYIRDRIKDMIKSGGENIDSVSVENALYEDNRIMEAAAVGLPDERRGELVAAVVYPKPAFKGQLVEGELIEFARKRLPRFAVPVMVIVREEPLERTHTEKIIKTGLRILAKAEWAKRRSANANSPLSKL